MKQDKPGMRVAVVSADMKTFLGYGVYLGDFPHPELIEEWAKNAENHPTVPEDQRTKLAARIRAGESPFGLNPKIRLDDGVEVWGCDCWWGDEDEFKKNGYAQRYGVADVA
jgi:hypothetical protein